MAKSRALQVQPFAPSLKQATRAEGYPLSLLKLPSSLDASKETVAFGLDISAAPVPQRRYAAEISDLRLQNGDLIFLFGQLFPDTDEVDSILSIRMNPIAGIQLLESIEGMKKPGLDGIAKSMRIEGRPLTKKFSKSAQMAKVVANLAAIAVSGFETCIDFYHASAFSMRQAATTKQLAVEPIVRVDIQTSVFISLVAELKTIRSTLPSMAEMKG